MFKEKNLKPVAFEFAATKQEVRSFLFNQEPWFVTKDVCSILGLSNSSKAISALDDDEKGVTKGYTLGGKQSLSIINESGLYTLILRSNKPEAKTFRKWVTKEVLPSIRKKGYYASHQPNSNFIDARDVPFMAVLINEFPVRVIELQETKWFSINDYHNAINSRTCSTQTAKKLNVKDELAKKIQLFGSTHPAWFTTELGLQLIASGSRIMKSNQLKLIL